MLSMWTLSYLPTCIGKVLMERRLMLRWIQQSER